VDNFMIYIVIVKSKDGAEKLGKIGEVLILG
jgi:hypothetical protein